MRISSVIMVLIAALLPGALQADFESQRLQTDGLLHRLRARIEKPVRQWKLVDSSGQGYLWDGRSLETFLYDDNARFAIPRTDEAAFVQARARAFEENGMTDRAAELYAALEAMDGRYFAVSADVRAVAKQVPAIEFQNPVVLIHENTVHVISDDTGIHLSLPGLKTESVRLLREKTEERTDRTGYVLRLFSDYGEIMIFLDRFWKPASYPDAGSYSVLSDLRRGFDWQRKERTDFERKCRNGICTVAYKEKGIEKGWQEILDARSGTGFVVSVSPAGEAAQLFLQIVLEQYRARLKNQ